MKSCVQFNHWPSLFGALLLLSSPFATAQTAALSWDKDIQAIVKKSCVSCHFGVSPIGGIALETEAQVLKLNTGIRSRVSAGQMPPGEPGFAESVEGKKLLMWLVIQAEPQLTWEKDIKAIVASSCGSCHAGIQPIGGVVIETEAQTLKLNASIADVVTKGLMPVGNPDFATGVEGRKLLTWLKIQATTVPQLTYLKNIKPIIVANCQSCHTAGNAAAGLAFDVEADLVKNSKIIASEVSSGGMPLGNAEFKNSADAKVLLDWIKSLKPVEVPAI